MGVCGTGKSTVGEQLAAALGWAYADADNFHPPENVEKMRAGTPLNDVDRGPWLDHLRELLTTHQREQRGLVLACSALKSDYRRRLQPATPVSFVFLHGTPALLAARMGSREGHYMPASLLDSQLATLEPPSPDEAIWCDVANSPAAIVAQVLSRLRPR